MSDPASDTKRQPAASATGADTALTPEMTRYALVMLTIAYTFNFVDRQILVILQESIKQDMGLSDTQLGLLSGFSFALVYITAGIPIALWADRGNRRNIIGLAIAVWSGMTALSGLAQNYSQLLLARIGVGIGEAGGSPPAHSMISDYYPPEKRGWAMSFYSAGLHFGIVIGFLLGGAIDAYFGWRVAFFVVGLPGVAFAAVLWLTVKEPPRGRWESVANASDAPTLRETLRVLGGYRSFWYLSAACGLSAFAGYGNGNFIPSFLSRSHGLEQGQIGALLAFLLGGAGMVGTLLGGSLADRLGVRDARWYLWVPFIASIAVLPLTIPYLLSENTSLVIVLLGLVSILLNTYIGPCLATVHRLAPPAMRALASAILFFVLNLIGLGLGPLVAGILSDYFTAQYGSDGLRYAMIVVATMATLSVPMFWLAARRLPEDLAASERLAAGER